MTRAFDARRSTSALAGLMRLGKPGRHAGLQLDVVRELGPVRSVRWRDALGAAAEVHPTARRRLYRELWHAAAAAVGATVGELDGDFLRITRRDRSIVVWQNLVPVDDPVTLKLAGDKPASHRLLADAGIGVVDHVEVRWDALAPVVEMLQQGPCVVKPATSTGRGTGVTCGVSTGDELLRAALRASRWDDRILVERLLVGEELRLTVFDGEVLGCIRRRPPCVLGDGSSSVGDLVAAENERRRRADGDAGVWIVRIDLDLLLTLARQGLDIRSVPRRGERVQVKTAVNENGPADNETMDVPAPMREAAIAAARALGVRLAGVEIVTADPHRSLAETGGAVVEVNTTPGLLYHYQVADPTTARPVAVDILESLLGSPT